MIDDWFMIVLDDMVLPFILEKIIQFVYIVLPRSDEKERELVVILDWFMIVLDVIVLPRRLE